VWNTHRVADVTVRPISPDQHDAVLHYFDLVAYADNPNWSKCYCMRSVEAYPIIGEVPRARWTFANYLGPLSMYMKI
jgi:hypothetical protein